MFDWAAGSEFVRAAGSDLYGRLAVTYLDIVGGIVGPQPAETQRGKQHRCQQPPRQITASRPHKSLPAAHTNHCQPPTQITASRPYTSLPAAHTNHCQPPIQITAGRSSSMAMRCVLSLAAVSAVGAAHADPKAAAAAMLKKMVSALCAGWLAGRRSAGAVLAQCWRSAGAADSCSRLTTPLRARRRWKRR